jgi:hypothetical protein
VDDAVINISGITVTHTIGSHSVRSLTSQADVNFSAGSLVVATDSEIDGALNLSGGGTLSVGGNLKLEGQFTCSGGTLSGSGRAVADGGVILTGFGIAFDAVTLVNTATATWLGTGDIRAGRGAIWENAAGATFDIRTEASFTWNSSGVTPTFDNAGTVVKSAGIGTTPLRNVTFLNSGTLEVQTGAVSLAAGRGTGLFTADAGATLTFAGNYSLTADCSIGGDGNVFFAGGTVDVAGSYGPRGTTRIDGGTADFLVDANLGALALNTGTLTGPSSLTVAGPLTWTGGTMSGTGVTVAAGGMTISGIAVKSLNARTLDNAGAATWTGTGSSDFGGAVTASNGAVINNSSGATFLVQMDSNISSGFLDAGPGPSVFNNAGTFLKSSAETVIMGLRFENTGAVQAQAGTLQFTGAVDSSGVTEAGQNSTLAFLNNTFSFDASSIVRGAGTVRFSPGAFTSASANIAGTYDVVGTTFLDQGNVSFRSDDRTARLTMSASAVVTVSGSLTATDTGSVLGGSLSGTGNVTIAGSVDWMGAGMLGPGHTIVTGRLNIRGMGLGDGRTLDNAGTVVLSGNSSIAMFHTAILNNLAGAIFDVRTDIGLSAGFNNTDSLTFNNAGTFRKSAGSGTTAIDHVQFNNTGVVEVESGTLRLAGGGTGSGSFAVSAGATLSFVNSAYSLTDASSVSGAGTVRFTVDPSEFSNVAMSVSGTYDVGTTSLDAASGPSGKATVNFFGQATTGNLLITNFEVLAVWGSFTVTGTAQTNVGVMAGAGDVIIQGTLSVSGGNMSGTGRTIILGSITMNAAPPGFSFLLADSRTLDIAGTATWLSGIALSSNATVNNLAGATFIDQSGGAVGSFAGLYGTFNNAGTYVRRGPSGGGVQAMFQNTGSVDLQTGTFSLFGGSSSGSFQVEAGAGLFFFLNTYNLTATSVVSGAGTVGFNGGTTNVQGTYDFDGTTVINGGTANFLVNARTGASTLSAGTLTGPGSLTVSGMLTWTGGTMSGNGTTAALGGMTISGTANKTLDGRTLNNADTAIWTAGDVSGGNGAVLNNLPGATLDLQGTGTLLWNSAGTTPLFNNQGTVLKSMNFGAASIIFIFDNAGTVNVQRGTLVLSAGGDSTGSMTVASGTTLQFADPANRSITGTVYTLASSSSIAGAGTVEVGTTSTLFGDMSTLNLLGSYTVTNTLIDSGTANFVADTTIEAMTFRRGTLTGPGNLTVTRLLNWIAGTMTGGGTTTSTGGLAFIEQGGQDLSGRTLVNTGTASIGGRMVIRNGGLLDNQAAGTFLIRSNADIAFPIDEQAGTFTNEGTLRKQDNTGSGLIRVPFVNRGIVDLRLGTLSFTGTFAQTAGNTMLASGTTLAASTGVNVQGGSLAGSGTVSGNVINSGVVSPGGDGVAGILTINGSYTQTSTGELLIDLGGTTVGTQYDQLHVNGSVTLDGSLVVELIDGFSPSAGQSFQILTFSSRTGDFATMRFPDLGTLFLDPVYNSTSLTLVTRTR